MNEYKIEEHRHRFAVWAAAKASQAARVKELKVSLCRERIAQADAAHPISEILNFSQQKSFDDWHCLWREIISGEKIKSSPVLSHGVAAKIINIYLKCMIISAGSEHSPVAQFVHPPIDSYLLGAMDGKITSKHRENNKSAIVRPRLRPKSNIPMLWADTPWSKLNSNAYQDLVDDLVQASAGMPLWKFESYWQPDNLSPITS